MAPPAPPVAPPPPPPPTAADNKGASNEDAAGALFAEISKLGENGVRSGLKKATKGPVSDENKHPNEMGGVTAVPLKKKQVNLGGEPKCSLSGKKWTIEYQNGKKGDDCVSIDTDLKQTVYVYKCHDSLIKINGKVNAIVLDCCSKTACIFEEALASVEIVNSKDIQIQCTKNAPALSIDGCTSVTYYMSSTYKDAQIITAKSAAINLIRPTDDDGTLLLTGTAFFQLYRTCSRSPLSNKLGF